MPRMRALRCRGGERAAGPGPRDLTPCWISMASGSALDEGYWRSTRMTPAASLYTRMACEQSGLSKNTSFHVLAPA